MNNDSEYVNTCLPTFYLLSLTDTKSAFHLSNSQIFAEYCLGAEQSDINNLPL